MGEPLRVGLQPGDAGYIVGVIHLFHPHDGLNGALFVYLDDIKVAHLPEGATVNVNGSGQSQELIARATFAGESPVLMITDPGSNGVDRRQGELQALQRHLQAEEQPAGRDHDRRASGGA